MTKGTFGDNLKREREMRGVSLDEISAATRIATRFLHAIENEQWDQLPGGVFKLPPIRVSDFGDDLSPLLQRFEHDRYIELPLQRRFDADLYVVEVDEDRDLEMLIHGHLRVLRNFGALLPVVPIHDASLLHGGLCRLLGRLPDN